MEGRGQGDVISGPGAQGCSDLWKLGKAGKRIVTQSLQKELALLIP